jgi:hypothetical protein
VLVEGEIGHQPFEPGVLLFHLPQSTQFAHAEVGVLLFPGVEGLLSDAELPTDIPDGGATLGLPDGIDDLLFGEFDRFIDPLLSSRTAEAAISTLVLECRRFPGGRHS